MRVRRIISFAFCAILILSTVRSARAQDAASAKSFLHSIFQLYENHGKGIRYRLRYLHSSFLSLIHADLKAAAAASEVPWPLDSDIVCDCQEWDGIWVNKMDVKLEKPARARVVVTFYLQSPENRSDGDLRTMQYTLVAERGQWRIYDIEDLSGAHDPAQPRSLRKQILKDIRDLGRESR